MGKTSENGKGYQSEKIDTIDEKVPLKGGISCVNVRLALDNKG